ncbi:response regulator transcription factor [Alteribacter natronophilus]|uniref:response regulator transcription factor n=1 Tax=Alteribacter natronophilus TaxID=2583810 RepID=UPI001486BECA|nr:response regulator [Alteribacter natronophilus]
MTRKILIADRSDFARELLKDLISSCESCEFYETQSAVEAVRLFAEKGPDLTFLDLVLNNGDGFTVLRTMRELERDKCIVICTALAQTAVKVDAMQSGASAFLAKPLSGSRIESILKNETGS